MATDEEMAKLSEAKLARRVSVKDAADLKILQDKIAVDSAFRADFFRTVNKAVSEVSAAHDMSFDPADIEDMRATLRNVSREEVCGVWIAVIVYAN